uniref:UEV domain-containing protein n=1 Tax=Mola mola TaxID=94237 RepID=A0A3Q3X6E3_MOLML
QYKFHDVAVEELQKIHRIFPGMIPSTGTYRSYNFPVQLWLLDSFPFAPPICLLRPTANMVIREGKHVDARGRIFLPGLHNWDYQPKSSVVGLLREMTAKFEEDPPLSSKTTEHDKEELLAFVSNLQITDGRRYQGNQMNKVSVIGGGDLGMASVMSILSKCNVDKLVFIDVAESSTKGGSTDLEIFSLPKVEVSRSAGSRVIVVTTNAWSNEQSYVTVVQTNVDLYREIIPNLANLSPNAVMIIASQPVDVMTHVAWRQSGLPPTQVIGAACNLDSERLSHILDINLNTHRLAWIIGELSDNKAFEMIKNRGQRSWSVGLSIADITNSVLTDKNKVHSVSTLAQGWGGISAEVFLSLPCSMGSNGSTRLAGVSLGQEEDAKLK